MADETPTFSPGDLIAKQRELKAFVESEDEAYKARMKPYKDGIVAIEGMLQQYLLDNNLQNTSSDDGTAYLKTLLTVKVDNRDAFLDFVVQDGVWDMLDVGALKEPVQAYMDAHAGSPPPGLNVSYFTKCNVRGK